MNRTDQNKDNRLLMPECSAVIDEFKEVFGSDQIKVTYANENGMTLGRPDNRFIPLAKEWVL